MKNREDTKLYCGKLIADLSGMDPKYRQSSKIAALEIVREGSGLYELVFKASCVCSGVEALRCAEACARAAAIKPELAKNTVSALIAAMSKCREKDERYFLAVILAYVNVPKTKTKKCGLLLAKWLKEETGKGPKAAFLEAIAHLAGIDSKLKSLATTLLEEALQSPVPSYSARARLIVMRKNKSAKKFFG